MYMKKIFVLILGGALMSAPAQAGKPEITERNFDFESYCDLIWKDNPDYYLDVLCETDFYQEYITKFGCWW